MNNLKAVEPPWSHRGVIAYKKNNFPYFVFENKVYQMNSEDRNNFFSAVSLSILQTDRMVLLAYLSCFLVPYYTHIDPRRGRLYPTSKAPPKLTP